MSEKVKAHTGQDRLCVIMKNVSVCVNFIFVVVDHSKLPTHAQIL